MKIKQGDTIRVITGKDKGREGKVVRVYPKADKALIENINMFKKHVKKNEQNPQGGIIEVPRPIHISNIMIVDAKTKKPSRIGYQIEEGTKKRLIKKSKQVIK
ncbi:50S ribosomal protein L24 [Candidatus Woesebacteria bacterium]|nr:50S ribosomal protein L24 [Candidatus Woesebacteria bacterium]